MNDGIVVVFLAGEDRQHRQVCGALADRVFLETIDWLGDLSLDHVRRWQGRSAEELYYLHKGAKEDAKKLGFRAHGFIDGKPAGPEAQWLRCILEVARAASPDAVVIARDLDGKPERRESFDTIMRCFPPPFPVVYAGPAPEIEAWIIAGYEPLNADEQRRLDKLAGELGFSPTAAPERLTSTARDHPADTKTVCDRLTAESEEREASCLDDLTRLRERGGGCGVKAYLDDVEEKIVQILRRPTRARR
jgi:hypothetical protein